MDEREQQLQAWARGLDGRLATGGQWRSVAGDASSRRYFRLAADDYSAICVDAPPQTEKNAAFLSVRDLLHKQGLRVPGVLGADLDRGFLLLEDLGDRLLLPLLDETGVDAWYTQALDQLQRMQGTPLAGAGLPAYSEAVLGEELSRFPEWFCRALLDAPWGAVEQQMFARVSDELIAIARGQPQVFVHRDFHSRNLLVLDDGALAMIDFQDALVGPVCYDLVSLLRDCYISWPAERVRGWALGYRARLLAQDRPAGDSAEEFLRWFDGVGLQRHLKVLGNFARLALRDDKPGYLADIPQVLDYILPVLRHYPQFADLAAWFEGEALPRVARQDWGRGR